MASNRRKKSTLRSSKRKRDTDPVRAQDPVATTAGSDDQQMFVSASIETVENAQPSNANYTTDTCPFLEIPPELRNLIYSYALPGPENCHSRNVANFRFPAITRVSKQVRHESLPILFAQCNFVFCIGVNIATRAQASSYLEMEEADNRSGTLGFKQVVKQHIVEAGDLALFKDVSLRMYLPQATKHVRYAADLDEPQTEAVDGIVAVLHLNVVGSTLHCRTENGSADLPGWYYGQYRVWRLHRVVRAVEDTLEDAERVAMAIAARDEFAGFTMQDLTRVAAAYRYRETGKRDPALI